MLLGEILIKMGKITPKQLDYGILYQHFEREKKTHAWLGRFFVEHSCITEEDLKEALEIQKSEENSLLDFLNNKNQAINEIKLNNKNFYGIRDNELFSIVSSDVVKKYNVFPVALTKNNGHSTLFLAMSNPKDSLAILQLKEMFHFNIYPLPSNEETINKYINKYYFPKI